MTGKLESQVSSRPRPRPTLYLCLYLYVYSGLCYMDYHTHHTLAWKHLIVLMNVFVRYFWRVTYGLPIWRQAFKTMQKKAPRFRAVFFIFSLIATMNIKDLRRTRVRFRSNIYLLVWLCHIDKRGRYLPIECVTYFCFCNNRVSFDTTIWGEKSMVSKNKLSIHKGWDNG